MQELSSPFPVNELERLSALSDLDLDYSSLAEEFKDLTDLAAKVAGTQISLINLIDSYTQWTVASHGLEIKQMPREESVCQYTIMQPGQFEVSNLSLDQRFAHQPYVAGPLALRYYFGIPLKSSEGVNLGALCLLDTQTQVLSPEKIELLKLIAAEVANRIIAYGNFQDMKQQLEEAKHSKAKVAHDIRGPLAGIIGLSEIIASQGSSTSLDEILEFVGLIHQSSKSILSLADEILTEDKKIKSQDASFNLAIFKEKLVSLFSPQAQYKGVHFEVHTTGGSNEAPIQKNKLLQIAGNLISNAIKFTPGGGTVEVMLSLVHGDTNDKLEITVSDTGQGISDEGIFRIHNGSAQSTDGTAGEMGFGFGLALVKHLIDTLGGTLSITSSGNKGSVFTVSLPQAAMPVLTA
jgi:signal transduction histidine kinase